MQDFLYYHRVDLPVYAAIALVVFAVARVANASPALALVFAAVPVATAWMYFNYGLQGLLPGLP
jgi:hypothetical protein